MNLILEERFLQSQVRIEASIGPFAGFDIHECLFSVRQEVYFTLISGVIRICQSIGLNAASPWKSERLENERFSDVKSYCANRPKKLLPAGARWYQKLLPFGIGSFGYPD